MKKNITKFLTPVLILLFIYNIKPLDKAIGFTNLGATCFMNATLQSLLTMDKFNDFLLKNKNKYHEDSISGSYINLFENYKAFTNNGAYDPGFFSEKMWGTILSEQTKGDHQDAAEFLTTLLAKITNEGSHKEEFKESISKYIILKLRSTITTQKTDMKEEDLTVMPLAISGSKLKYCISNFFGKEKPEGFDGIKQNKILDLPTYLIIQINRFSKEFKQGELRTKKIETDIEFDNTLDLQAYLYDQSENINTYYNLIGIVEHSGNLDSGHYIAYTKRGEKWYRFDDSKVTRLNPNKPPLKNVDDFTPYILFYEKGSDKKINYKNNKKIKNAKNFISKTPNKAEYKSPGTGSFVTWNGKTMPLIFALEEGSFDVIQTILNNSKSFEKYKIHNRYISLNINEKNQFSKTALQNAIEKSNLNKEEVFESIKYLINR